MTVEGQFVPTDHNGNPLKVGDVVAIPCVITGLDRHHDYVNVGLETRWPMHPGPNKTPIFLSSLQILLIQPSEKTLPESVHVLDVIEEVKRGSGIIK